MKKLCILGYPNVPSEDSVLVQRLSCYHYNNCLSGPSCSKLTMSLVNVNIAYMLIFLLKKCDLQKLLTFFSKNACELDIVLTRTVNILTTNKFVK